MVRLLQSNEGFANRLPIFATPEFLAARSGEYGWFAGEDFALPFIVEQKLCFRRLIFTTEAIPLSEAASPDKEREFLEAVLRVCEAQKEIAVDFISAPQANVVFRTVPRGCENVPWASYIVDLTRSSSEIFSGFHSKHRNVIRNAMTNEVAVAKTRDVGVIFRNLRETMSRQHLLFYPSEKYLNALATLLGENVTFYTASHRGQLQGCAVVVHNHLGAFYYRGGSIERPATGSLNLLQFEIMKDLQHKGVPVYDLMGARPNTGGNNKIENIQRFKARFASDIRQGYSFRSIIRPVKYRLFVTAVRGYFRLKGSNYSGDVIDQSIRAEQKLAMVGSLQETDHCEAASDRSPEVR